MIWRLIHIGKFIGILKMIFSLDTICKFKSNTTNCIGGWIGRVAQLRRITITKRLIKRQRPLHDTCKIMKRGPCKCHCDICTNVRSRHRQRVMETDLLENLAYQHRVTEERPSMNLANTQTNSLMNVTEEITGARQDHRDLQQSNCNGLAWWTDMTHRVFMPPLLQGQTEKPTRSECSITSYVHADSIDISDSFALSRSTTPTSDDSDYKSSSDVLETLPVRSGSKSDSKVTQSMKMKLKSVAKSVSIPLGQRPKELRGTKILAKRKFEMKRPVRRATSHTTDCFSNCVKCSRIVSRPCKKNTH